MARRFDIDVDDLRNWVALGWDQTTIADHLGCSAPTVCNAMKRAGLKALKSVYKRGKGHPAWKGGAVLDGKGYRLIYAPAHPKAYRNGYVPEHRVVVESHIGRYLRPDEHVHHRDKNTLNNKIENLQVLSPSDHAWLEKTRHDITLETIADAMKKGLSKREIAQKLKCCRATLEKRIFAQYPTHNENNQLQLFKKN